MKVLATYNIKGGVGKTASAVNLAEIAAREGARVLVWDLDPQGAATFYFRVKPKIKGGGKGLVKAKRGLAELAKPTEYERLDVVPADFSFRHLDLRLESAKKPTQQLRRLLKTLGPVYDYVFIDCPPSISLLSEAVFEAADALLVPLIPTTLSLRTFKQLITFRTEKKLGRRLKILGFFSQADMRKVMHRDTIATLAGTGPEILSTVIPNASAIEKMGLHQAPVATFAPRSAAADAYSKLWREIIERL
jgi:chromosome partitioning protein